MFSVRESESPAILDLPWRSNLFHDRHCIPKTNALQMGSAGVSQENNVWSESYFKVCFISYQFFLTVLSRFQSVCVGKVGEKARRPLSLSRYPLHFTFPFYLRRLSGDESGVFLCGKLQLRKFWKEPGKKN